VKRRIYDSCENGKPWNWLFELMSGEVNFGRKGYFVSDWRCLVKRAYKAIKQGCLLKDDNSPKAIFCGVSYESMPLFKLAWNVCSPELNQLTSIIPRQVIFEPRCFSFKKHRVISSISDSIISIYMQIFFQATVFWQSHRIETMPCLPLVWTDHWFLELSLAWSRTERF